MIPTTDLDRLAMRGRPQTPPVLLQNWEKLLFLHWPMDAAALRPLVPSELEIDLYDGQAWISVTPFAMTGVRLRSAPAIPGLDSFLELNVRTYVHYRGRPGIYFFSLDASKTIPVLAARFAYFLPYYGADMEFTERNGEFDFRSRRRSSTTTFHARWRVGGTLPDPAVDSIEFFLVERYAFFVKVHDEIRMVRAYHHPWVLEEATVLAHESQMISTLGISQPAGAPLAHFSRFLNVEVWEPVRL